MYLPLSHLPAYYLGRSAYYVSRALQKLGKRDVVGWVADREQCDIDFNPPGVTEDLYGSVAGPWREAKTNYIMHGIYWRPAGDGFGNHLEGMAVLNGWRTGTWSGPADLATWTHPLVSFWHPLLAPMRRGRLGLDTWLDTDEYAFESVVEGRAPYAHLKCNLRDYLRYADQADQSDLPLKYDYSEGNMWIGRTEPLGELFPGQTLADLTGRYRQVLTNERHSDHIAYLTDVIGMRGLTNVGDLVPAEYANPDRADDLWALPQAVRDLIHGYPPMATAGELQRMYAPLSMETPVDA